MIGGWVVWYIGDACGLGLFGAYVLSGLGSLLGVWVGWKLAQRFDD